VGTVRDTTGRPVPLAHVYARDSVTIFAATVGTVTDSAGRYTLRLRGRAPYLGARRIGYSPETPRPLAWNGADTLHADLVLRSIPYMLPTVYVGTITCLRLDSLPAQSDVRQLWEGAVATIAAREAFLQSYRYTQLAMHRNNIGLPAERIFDTTYVHDRPVAPLAKDVLSAPLATYRRPSFWHRKWEVHMHSPGDRLLLHPQFFERFCFDDGVIAADDGMIEIRFRERGRDRDDVEVVGTMTFKSGMPGPSHVGWDYLLGGKQIGRSEQVFELVDVNGTLFPLVTLQTLRFIDPRTAKLITETSIELRYQGFTRVAEH
jgi:hypothetical protein